MSSRRLTWKKTHIGQALEVVVLRPEGGLLPHRRRVNDAVRQWQGMARSLQRQRKVEVDDSSDLHHSGDLERVVLTAFPEDFLEDLVNGDDRNEEVPYVLNGGREKGRTLAAREIFEPAGLVHDVGSAHRRSSSLWMDVSMPRRKPRIC